MTAAPGTAADCTGSEADGALRREGDRIAQLIDDLGAMAGAPVRQRVEELVGRLVHLYGTALASLLRLFAGDGGGGPPQRLGPDRLARLRADPLLSSLLVLHGLHPDPEAAREFDPGPDPAARAAAPGPGGLVQIDLARSRAAKGGGGP
jgi:hypothetical protein